MCINVYFMLYDCTVCKLRFLYFSVTAQQGPGIVIAHPGQDIELSCDVIPSDPSTRRVAWL